MEIMRVDAMALSARKKILFAVVACLLVLLTAEVVLRCIYFQLKASSPTAIQSTIETLRARAGQQSAEHVIERFRDTRQPTWRALYGEPGRSLRTEFMRQYADRFASLVTACSEIDSQLVVLYIPSTDVESEDHRSEEICRSFFQQLTAEHGVPLLDVTEAVRESEWQQVTLLPHDDHFSRLGNGIVAEQLAGSLAAFADHRCSIDYKGTPAVCGDLQPNLSEPWKVAGDLPFVLQTNAQGFRARHDLEIPSQRQRILVLGDSYTFGVHLPNAHTFPAILQERQPQLEVLNGGVVGYTIVQQEELFKERASAVAPDITVLQVLDNDIYGMFFFTRSWFDRKGRRYQASEAEQKLLEELGLGELARW